MCKNAIGSDRNHLGEGINTSVLFMIAMVFVVLGSFLGVVWWSYRSERAREGRGEVFAPQGKMRWTRGKDAGTSS
jgi:heme/copper-type cytochrome/quinol oxidase subunit 2